MVLDRGGYDLNGIYCLEKYYAKNLTSYYDALTKGDSHNYYFGRADADLTQWMDYFIGTLERLFVLVKDETQSSVNVTMTTEPREIRTLDRRERIILSLFAEKSEITSSDVMRSLEISMRMARVLLTDWVQKGWLVVLNPSNRARSYGLTAIYRQYMNSLTAMK